MKKTGEGGFLTSLYVVPSVFLFCSPKNTKNFAALLYLARIKRTVVGECVPKEDDTQSLTFSPSPSSSHFHILVSQGLP